jgi:hypothetical protein
MYVGMFSTLICESCGGESSGSDEERDKLAESQRPKQSVKIKAFHGFEHGEW